MLYLTFDYMDTLKNFGSGVVQIVSRTAKYPRSRLSQQVAATLGLTPPDAFSEPEWATPEEFSLKQHFIARFGILWVVLRNLFFGHDPRFAMPAAWREQLIANAPKRMHTTAESVARALEPLDHSRLRSLGVVKMFATGVSHGASLAQCFHLYYNNVRQCVQAKALADGAPAAQVCPHLHSVHFGAYRWTDHIGRDTFRRLTGYNEDMVEQLGAPESSFLPSTSVGGHTRTEASMILAASGDAVAISLRDSTQQHIVDPIPRVDWRCGLFFARRGYVNVIEPIGLVSDSGEVVTLLARSRQARRLFLGSSPFRIKYHLAGNYGKAAGKLTVNVQAQRRELRDLKTEQNPAFAKKRSQRNWLNLFNKFQDVNVEATCATTASAAPPAGPATSEMAAQAPQQQAT